MRPLILDLLDVLAPLAVGASAFFVGKSIRRLPMAVRFILVILAIGIVVVGALSLTQLMPPESSFFVSRIGGSTVLLSWAAIFLVGIVWNVQGRSFSSNFLVALAVLAGVLIVIESGGRLWWRYREPESWARFPNNEGRLQQSSGATCSPTAAAMLLHHYGIRVSEREMAYLAGTSLFGTDAPSIARALRLKVEPLGRQVEVVQTDYERCMQLGAPFIAHVSGSSAGHALLIERMLANQVEILDPAYGARRTMSRADFEKIWDGTAIYLVGR